MTDAPTWATTVPSTAGVHTKPEATTQWTSLTQDQLNALRSQLQQSIVQIVTQDLTGGLSTSTPPDDQLITWAESLPILGPFITALTGGNADPTGGYAAISAFFNFAPGTDAIGDVLNTLLPLGTYQSLVDGICNVLGVTGTGHTWSDVEVALGLIPGPNIATPVGTGVIPGLDASKITSGSFAQSFVTGLTTTLNTLLPTTTYQSLVDGISGALGHTGAGHTWTDVETYLGIIPGTNIGTPVSTTVIPGLDASKITSGSFAQSFVTGLTSALGTLLPTTTYQSLIDGISNALGHTGSGHTWTDVETYLGIIPAGNLTGTLGTAQVPALDASKITTGTFAQSMVTGLAASLSSLLGTATFQNLVDNISNALGHSGTGHTVTDVETYLGIIPGTNIGSTVSSAVVPNLDASKITSGTFAQSFVTGLGTSLAALLPNTTYQSLLDNLSNALGHTGTGHTLANVETYLGLIPGSNIASVVSSTVVPGLDASKIVTGTFAQSFVTGLTSSLAALLPLGTYQSLVDGISNALGHSGTAHTWTDVETYLGIIPGPNIATAVSTAVVPGLDASKITSGTFAQSMIGGLAATLAAVLPASTYQSLLDGIANTMGQAGTGHTLAQVETYLGLIPGGNIASTVSTSVVPNLDASKITTGTFAQSFVTGLGTSLAALLPATTYQSLLDNMSNALGHTGTGHTLANVESYLGLIPGGNIASPVAATVVPGLDASKITTGTFAQSLVTGLGTSLAALLPNTTYQALLDNIANAMGQSGTGHTLTQVEGYLGLIPGGNIASVVAASVVPALDASKITSGSLTGATVPGSQLTGSVLSSLLSGAVALGLIPALPASQITSGAFGTGQIPALDASKITSGSFAQSFITGLTSLWSGWFGTTTPTGATKLTVATVPSLPASQITSGSFGTGQIPGLDASKITSGTFAQSLVTGLGTTLAALLPNSTYQSLLDGVANSMGQAGTGHTLTQVEGYLGLIPGTNIASVIAATVVPALDASKITSGSLTGATVPGSQLTGSILSSLLSGAVALGLIPALPASQITSGTLGTGQIPALDASKITTGTFAQSMIGGLAATLAAVLPASTYQSLLDGVANALGHTGTAHTLTDVETYLGIIPGSNIGSLVSTAVVPGLDASKITSGSFAQSLVTGLGTSLAALLPSTTYQSLLDNIANAMGHSGTGFTLANVESYLGLIPGGNIASTVAAGVIPGLDASKITSGSLTGATVPGSQLTGSILSSLLSGAVALGLIPALPASQITSGTLGTGLIPGLDASKITSGTFAQSLVTGLGTSLAALLPNSTYQALLDNMANALGHAGTGFTLANVESYLGLIPGSNIASTVSATVVPGLDASKITTGSFAQSLVTGLGTSLAALLPNTTYQSLLDNIANAMGQSGTGHTLTQVESYLGLIPGGNIASAVAASVVPALDASKITSGSLTGATVPGSQLTGSVLSSLLSGAVALGLIPALPASQITSGTLGTGQVPSLDASKITTGTFGQSFITGLTSLWSGWFGTTTPTGSTKLTLATVPALPASQITSGAFGSGQIPALDASKITSGSLTGATVPGSQLTGSVLSSLLSGAVALGLIPSLPASQITSGTLGTGQIPALDASKIGSGSFAQSFVTGLTSLWSGWFGTTTPTGSTKLQLATVPALPASQITTGAFGAGQIPSLDASKITTGTIPIGQIPTSSLGATNITDIQTLIDNLANLLTGTTGTQTQTTAADAIASQASTVQANSTALAAIMASQQQSAQGGGTNVAVNLAAYPTNTTALPSIFSTMAGTLAGFSAVTAQGLSYNSTGFGITNRVGADWGITNGYEMALYNAAVTQTDYQTVSCVFASQPGNNEYFEIFGRCNTAGTIGVSASIGGGAVVLIVFNGSTYTTLSGSLQVFAFQTGAIYQLVCGVAGSVYTYELLCNGSVISSGVDSGHTFVPGSTYRRCGFGGIYNGSSPLKISSFTFADNAAPPVIGSAFRQYRNSATATSGLGTGNQLFPNSFFNAQSFMSTDYTYTTTGNKLTVSVAGVYMVTVSCAIATSVVSQLFRPLLYQNGVLVQGGQSTYPQTSSYQSVFGGTFLVSCAAGDTIQPGMYSSYATNAIAGDTAGLNTYFEVALVNTSVQG